MKLKRFLILALLCAPAWGQTYDIAASVSAMNFSNAVPTAGRDTTAAENV